MPTITAFFAKAYSLIEYAIAAGLIPPPLASEVATLMADLTNLFKGAAEPTVELAASVAKLLSDLSTAGLLTGKIPAALVNDAEKFSAFASDIKSGQAGIEGRATILGIPGSQVFIPDGGPAAQALGLS